MGAKFLKPVLALVFAACLSGCGGYDDLVIYLDNKNNQTGISGDVTVELWGKTGGEIPLQAMEVPLNAEMSFQATEAGHYRVLVKAQRKNPDGSNDVYYEEFWFPQYPNGAMSIFMGGVYRLEFNGTKVWRTN